MNDKHLEKIRKCLELSKSANENEASNALHMAQALMRKYGIGQDDVDFMDMGMKCANSNVGAKPTRYTSYLGTAINGAFGVMYIYMGNQVCFFGEKSSAIIAAYTFDILFRQLKFKRTEYIKQTTDKRFKRASKTKIGDTFAEGFVLAIIMKLEDQEPSPEMKEKMLAFRDKTWGEMEKATIRSAETSKWAYDAHDAGRNAGDEVEIRSGVSGTERTKIASF